MIYLNSSGIYNIVGEEYELLVKVIGHVPTLRIISGIRLNDFVNKGKIVELKEESIEIQQIMINPEKFVFTKVSFSTVADKLIPSRKINGIKKPYYNDAQFKEFVNHYKDNINIPGRGKNSTIAFIMEETGWSVAQSNCVILQIINYVRREESIKQLNERDILLLL